jgi:death-on-curing protein
VTVWLTKQIIIAVHEEQLAEHGGAMGIRDPGLLESALARPLNLAGYGSPDVAELAAMYALGIIRNHPFIDGNKRTGFAAMFIFLSFNGMTFDPPEVDATITILRLAASDLSDDEFIDWVRMHALPKS